MTIAPQRLPECGVARFLVLLDGPWATLIVRELIHGPQRFSELRRALGSISAHTLTHRLRRLETYEIVTRTAYAEVPPRVVYELTPLGLELEAVLVAMGEWATKVSDPADDEAAPVRTRLDRSCDAALTTSPHPTSSLRGPDATIST